MSVDTLTPPVQRSWEFIRARINDIRDIPHPDQGWWAPRESEIEGQKIPTQLWARGLLERRRGNNHDWYEYRMKPGTHEAIQAELERRDLLPCGYAGLTTLGDDQYSCGYEHCDAIHDRDTVEEVLT